MYSMAYSTVSHEGGQDSDQQEPAKPATKSLPQAVERRAGPPRERPSIRLRGSHQAGYRRYLAEKKPPVSEGGLFRFAQELGVTAEQTTTLTSDSWMGNRAAEPSRAPPLPTPLLLPLGRASRSLNG